MLIGLIDSLVPAAENPHAVHGEAESRPLHSDGTPTPAYGAAVAAAQSNADDLDGEADYQNSELMRMGLFTALAIGIHNFPEGLATFLAALQDPELGVAIAVAIALHNIPEGVSVS
ncbi:MAG: ZIP family metal transporter, partial [Anaerolineae bacterium]